MNMAFPLARPLKASHEQFILHIHQGFSGRQAYQRAYPKASPETADVQASRLLSNPKVQARLAELRAEMAAAQKIDLPFLTTGLLRAYTLGMQTKQASAASQAMMGIAKLHGFVVDRALVDTVVRKPTLDPTSPDEMSESKWLTLTLPSTAEPQGSEGSEPSSTVQVDPSIPKVVD